MGYPGSSKVILALPSSSMVTSSTVRKAVADRMAIKIRI
jgi:hypothetical protein